MDRGALPRAAASPPITRKATSDRGAYRQVGATVSSRSENRLPASLSAVELPLRHSTAGHRGRSDSLLFGFTPSTRARVHSVAYHLPNSRHSPAALAFTYPRCSPDMACW